MKPAVLPATAHLSITVLRRTEVRLVTLEYPPYSNTISAPNGGSIVELDYQAPFAMQPATVRKSNSVPWARALAGNAQRQI